MPARSHGLTRSLEFYTWTNMKNRCDNPRSQDYHNYGGRGIKVCKRWLNFENFLKDMGVKPSRKHCLDRINNDGNYEPSNCRWATRLEQAQNKRNKRLDQFSIDELIGELKRRDIQIVVLRKES